MEACIMQMDIIFVLAMIIALIGSAIFLKEVITASKPRGRWIAFGKYAACVAAFLLCAWGYVFSNNLLWYGQNPEIAELEININAEAVEDTSFLYLLEKLDATATPEDVIAVMGATYEEQAAGNYIIRYIAPNHTLNGEQPAFISFVFNKKGTEILKIIWSYADPASDYFTQIHTYLENNAFGTSTVSTASTADWPGLHLEDTGEYLLLQRIF